MFPIDLANPPRRLGGQPVPVHHALAENPLDRLIDQVVAPDRRTIPVSGGDLLPDLEKRLLESGLLEEPAFLCLVAPSRRRVQVDQDQDAHFPANRQQRIEPLELRVDPRVVGRQVAPVGRPVGKTTPDQLPADVVGLPLAAEHPQVLRADSRADHRAPQPVERVALVDGPSLGRAAGRSPPADDGDLQIIEPRAPGDQLQPEDQLGRGGVSGRRGEKPHGFPVECAEDAVLLLPLVTGRRSGVEHHLDAVPRIGRLRDGLRANHRFDADSCPAERAERQLDPRAAVAGPVGGGDFDRERLRSAHARRQLRGCLQAGPSGHGGG